MLPDSELLRRYAERKDQTAFAELVQRHLPLVYGAALRQLAGASHRAEEVTQAVFIDLARKSALLSHRAHLAGWLYRSTHYAAAKLKRSEQRRQHREEEAQAMNQSAADSGDLDWDQLRPVLDDVLHELPERDRTAVLMRFFEGRSFGEMGRQLAITEDATRMRVDRALARLRSSLGRRHITSTSAALVVLLSHQPAVAIPSGLAVSIGNAALLVSPAPASLLSLLLVSKITAPLIAGATATALTLGIWSVVPAGVTGRELQDLRAESARLRQAAAPGAPAELQEAAARAYADRALAVARHVEQRRTTRPVAVAGADERAGAVGGAAKSDAAALEHRNHGIATPRDAMLTFAWASDAAEVDALAEMIWFDPEVRAKAAATMATLPESLISQYPTPERFYGFILAALGLQAPPPGAEIIEQMLNRAAPTEVRPGRLAYPNRHELQQTPGGWKWVFPEIGVTRWLHVLGDSVLTDQPQP